ncbi:PilZ domain-containing protein [Sphingomonas sp. PB4P5]|uniref:PilZ domain-containing protein n=1 Tax=Parasphingomonas puruogangriensis TaxID=3096155 RepID=UPI002FCA79D4
MFVTEYEPAQASRRRAPRAPVSLDARIGRGGLDRTACKVSDLSINGARVHSYCALVRGTLIWLTLPALGQVAATVIWASDFEAGCRFLAPLDESSFATLVALGAA